MATTCHTSGIFGDSLQIANKSLLLSLRSIQNIIITITNKQGYELYFLSLRSFLFFLYLINYCRGASLRSTNIIIRTLRFGDWFGVSYFLMGHPGSKPALKTPSPPRHLSGSFSPYQSLGSIIFTNYYFKQTRIRTVRC